jgi:ATP-dependent RNA helicase RhlE
MNEIPNFDSLGLIEPLLKALRAQGYEKPTPIQASAIPIILSGRDLLGCARTGTGKTAAFALPCLQFMESGHKPVAPRSTRMLVLTPTRELAAQVEESFRVYGAHTGLKFALAFGGVGKAPQVKALERGVDVLVATPGRLLDLRNDGAVKLDAVEYFVLDEADRMLDMGFIHDMRKVFSFLPKKRQTMLFSATMPKTIKDIASSILINPAFVSVDPVSAPALGIEQRLYYAAKDQKRALLVKLLSDGTVDRALVFTRTKHLANRIAAGLKAVGIEAEAIHANKSQTHRTKVMAAFKSKGLRVLVATDIAARGIDVDELPHVINFEIPNEPETYVHRIGRTARAGASGSAFSFCEDEERPYIKAIEKLIGVSIPVVALPELPDLPPAPTLFRPARGPGKGRVKETEEKRETGKKPAIFAKLTRQEKAIKEPKASKEPKAAKPTRDDKRGRAPQARDEDAMRRENAAKIRDQIAHATGGAEGKARSRAAPEAARVPYDDRSARPAREEHPKAIRHEPPKDEGRGYPPKRPQAADKDEKREVERIPSPFPPEQDRRGQQQRGYGQQQNRHADQGRNTGGRNTGGRDSGGRDSGDRKQISDEEAARRAANDPRQPGIIPFNGPPPRPQPQQHDRPGQRQPFGRNKGGRRS